MARRRKWPLCINGRIAGDVEEIGSTFSSAGQRSTGVCSLTQSDPDWPGGTGRKVAQPLAGGEGEHRQT